MKKNVILFVNVIISLYCNAINFDQTFNIKTFSVNEGLSQFTTSKVVQDRYGFIWVSTYDGLNRFDGNDFVKYRHNPYVKSSISGNRVIELYIDKDENLWVVTENGAVDKYNYRTDQFEHFEFDPLKYSIVTVFYNDTNNNYWIGTTNGLYKTSKKENRFEVESVFLNSSNPGLENYVTSVVENSKQGLIVGTTSGAILLTNKGGQVFSPYKFLSNLVINLVFKDHNQTIWICSTEGLFYLSNDNLNLKGVVKPTDLILFNGFSERNIRTITEVDPNNYIVFSMQKVYILHLPTKIIKELKFSNYSFFNNNMVNSTLVDKTKNVWIASQQKGIAKLDLHQIPKIISKIPGTEGMFVKSVFKDSHERVWVGTNYQGLFYYDTNGIIKSIVVPGIPPQFILISPSIVEDKTGKIWFSINSRIFCYDYTSNQLIPFEQLYPKSIKLNSPFSLEIDAYNSIWIGCANGLIRIYLNDKKFKNEFISIGNLSDMLSSEQISRIKYDKIHNMIWACTKDNGVAAIFLNKSGKVQKIKYLQHNKKENSLSSNHVWSVIVASDSSVWFGSDSGLNKCVVSGNNLIVSPLNELQKIGNNKVMSLIEDKSNSLWAGTSQALFSYNYKTGKEKKYTISNGLYANAALEGMYMDSGLLYVGTINGLNVINTSPQPHNPFLSNVQITDITISGRSIKSDPNLSKKLSEPLTETKKIVLKYNENNINIHFLATQYNDFDENAYEYQLEGFDKDSITTDSKNRTVIYNRLPPGKYRFWVKASNNENVWGGEKRYLTIVVKSAPWLTIWAYSAYFLLILGIMYVVYRYLSRETKLKQQLVIKELENQHETEINNIRLRFHTNIAHDIRTPLTLIAGPLEDIKHNSIIVTNPFLNDRIGIVDKNVTRLLYLVNQFLDFRRLLNDGSVLHPDVHVVSSVFNDIKKSFDGIAASKKIHFEFIIDISDKFLIFDVDKFTKILYNLISNAFKYTDNGGDVFVFVEQNNNMLVIKVQDTGCGISNQDLPHIFDRFFQSTSSVSASGTGIGLALVKQLVDLCKGKIEAKSELNEGTEFVVLLPCEIPTEVFHTEMTEEIEQEKEVEDTVNTVNEGKKAIVLVVEDDDDLRSYLVKSFKNNYTVIQAINGQDGFDKALRYTPDVILTDVMMPQVDGIALIRLIRNDYRTSHIPIIVLTAKADDYEEIKALEAGAEDFISKPFSTKSLVLKVNNYVRNLSGKKQTESESKEVKIVDREQQFLNQMNQIILDNLENPIFSIDFICEKISISRMQLHRKIGALLGKSTSEYIREIKLDEAKRYFEKGERDIESVMLMIGLNSSFHFNKNFKARFGMTIHEFIRSLNKTD
ncbi:MAG: response regulator [Paludibacter sp.]|nr:response regulator [Paludibacter sp.]